MPGIIYKYVECTCCGARLTSFIEYEYCVKLCVDCVKLGDSLLNYIYYGKINVPNIVLLCTILQRMSRTIMPRPLIKIICMDLLNHMVESYCTVSNKCDFCSQNRRAYFKFGACQWKICIGCIKYC